jgi:transcriptional regulator with XRE-family HTH domain
MTTSALTGVGDLLRAWRQRRRLTQLDLANASRVSTRHLSYIETGRARPTPTMILGLAEQLDVPLRERNRMLLAAGHAPAYAEHELSSAPLAAVCAAITALLRGHEPFPAVVLDRAWDLVDANDAARLLMAGAAPHLLEPPVNLMRLSLHPDGMAPRIRNFGPWRGHLLHRLERQVAAAGDPELEALFEECHGYPGPESGGHDVSALFVPLVYDSPVGVLSLFGTTTVFGSPHEVTTSEIAIESFYPSDAESADRLRAAAQVDFLAAGAR